MPDFPSLDVADHLENFSGVELAPLLLFGKQYVDVDSLKGAFHTEYGADQSTF